jgi:hypothetical protein
MVARWRDCRKSADVAGQSQEEREFNARWETYHIADRIAGQPGWMATRRRGHLQHACPKDMPLETWVNTLRTKLLVEWD